CPAVRGAPAPVSPAPAAAGPTPTPPPGGPDQRGQCVAGHGRADQFCYTPAAAARCRLQFLSAPAQPAGYCLPVRQQRSRSHALINPLRPPPAGSPERLPPACAANDG